MLQAPAGCCWTGAAEAGAKSASTAGFLTGQNVLQPTLSTPFAPCVSNMMFSGLMSMCATPSPCTCARYCSKLRAISATAASVNAARLPMCSKSSPPAAVQQQQQQQLPLQQKHGNLACITADSCFCALLSAAAAQAGQRRSCPRRLQLLHTVLLLQAKPDSRYRLHRFAAHVPASCSCTARETGE